MKREQLRQYIFASKGKKPVDLVIKNARIINVFNGEIEKNDIAVFDRFIVGLGGYSEAKNVIDVQGAYVVPGLIEAHTHMESSLLCPAEYARVVIPHGTAAVVTDPHELANVKGLSAIDYFIESTQDLPLKVYFTSPSCVPVASFDASGAKFTGNEIRKILQKDRVVGLGEMMNYPGLLSGDADVLEIILAAESRRIDGHAPELRGKSLDAYLMANVHADHESTELEEAREKLRKGMYVMIREGSSERNLEALLPLVNEKTIHRCMFVSDDKDCVDLYYNGHLDSTIRKAIDLGLDPMMAIRMTTLNPAEFFRLRHHGAIAPGYYADFLVVDDLEAFDVREMYCKGKLVAKDGEPLFQTQSIKNTAMFQTINIGEISEAQFCLKSSQQDFPVIELVPGNVITKKRYVPVKNTEGRIPADVERDLLLIACVERHHRTGKVGVGLVKGFGLKQGALASSVAHDSHNIIVVGTNSRDMYTAVKHLESLQGGLAVVNDEQILADLPLPIGGLLSILPAAEVIKKKKAVRDAAHELDVTTTFPFMQLSFLALPVIPEIRIIAQGLFDVEKMGIITV